MIVYSHSWYSTANSYQQSSNLSCFDKVWHCQNFHTWHWKPHPYLCWKIFTLTKYPSMCLQICLQVVLSIYMPTTVLVDMVVHVSAKLQVMLLHLMVSATELVWHYKPKVSPFDQTPGPNHHQFIAHSYIPLKSVMIWSTYMVTLLVYSTVWVSFITFNAVYSG